MAGNNYATIPAAGSSNLALGTQGTVLVGVVNQSLTNQAASIQVWDAPASAVASPSGYTGAKLLFQAYLTAGNSGLLGNLNIRVNYGVVVVPSAAANADGGWTFLYQ